ncbi:hypothetical protein LPJ64_006400, partial [Coemansia asiatica]
KSSVMTKPRAVSLLTAGPVVETLASRGAAAATTTVTTKRQTRVLATSKNAAVQRCDSHDVVAA